MFVIALVGLSGVGKSTLLSALEKRIPFRHFAASELIKAELARSKASSATSEDLRVGPVLDNQTLLASAFERSTRGLAGLVVLDGHTVIDTPSGLIEIPAAVFGALGVSYLLFLKAHPDQIVARRQSDLTRVRPHRTSDEIQTHQEFALIVTEKIAKELRIPFSVCDCDDLDYICEVFTDVSAHNGTA